MSNPRRRKKTKGEEALQEGAETTAPAATPEPWEVDEVAPAEAERVERLVNAFTEGPLSREHLRELVRPQGAQHELRACGEHPWSALHVAAMVGDVDAVRGLLRCMGPDMCTWRAGCSARTACVAAIKVGQLTTARLLHRAAGGSCGQQIPPLKLLTFAVRSGSLGVTQWLQNEVEKEALQDAASDVLFKLFSAAVALEGAAQRGPMVLQLARDSPRARSVALACAGARQCEEALEALAAQPDVGVLQESEYNQMQEQLPPGTFIEMIKSLLRYCPEGTTSLLGVSGKRLLCDAVVAGSPDLCSLLLARGCRCVPERGAPPGNVWEDPLWICALGVPAGHPHIQRVKLGTDHSVRMAQMLLAAGATPYLADKRGNRLLEALWCGFWWSTGGRSGPIKPHKPKYELEDNRLRMMMVIRKFMCVWTPQRHALFPASWRSRVFALLCCNSRCRRQGRAWLPKDVLKVLLGWMAVAEAHNDNYLRNALESFRKENISDVLLDKGCLSDQGDGPEEDGARDETAVLAGAGLAALPGAAAGDGSPQSQGTAVLSPRSKSKKKKKKTKQDLVDEAVRRREEEDQRSRRQLSNASGLPAVIGKLVGREETSGVSFELDIVNPSTQPWVNIGRSFVKHPKGGATLDMDLSPVEFNRRISRLHATIRFNVLDRRWEVQIRGRNGIEIDRGTLAGPELCLPSSQWLPLPSSLSFRMPFANLTFQLYDMVPRHQDNEDTHN